MSEARGHGRRSSKRLEEKEDAPMVNGIEHDNELAKGSQKENVKSGKAKTNGNSTKPSAKRKPGKWARIFGAGWASLGFFNDRLGKFHLPGYIC